MLVKSRMLAGHKCNKLFRENFLRLKERVLANHKKKGSFFFLPLNDGNFHAQQQQFNGTAQSARASADNKGTGLR